MKRIIWAAAIAAVVYGVKCAAAKMQLENCPVSGKDAAKA